MPDPIETEGVDEGERIRTVARELGLPLTTQQTSELLRYRQLLQRWNARYNLTAVRDPDGMLTQHLADCLAVLPALERQGIRAGRVLDVGSGGGLPGVVLALMLPGLDVTCVDAVGKKVAFVQQVASSLRLDRLHAVHTRVQALKLPRFDLITCRAFASLPDFCAWTASHLATGGCWMAMKGMVPEAEIAALPSNVEVFHVEHLEVPGLHAERCLVWMRPRSPGR